MMMEEVGILRVLWPILLLQVLLTLWALIDLVRRKQVRALPKWAWALIVLFVNFFGAIVYLVFGRGEE